MADPRNPLASKRTSRPIRLPGSPSQVPLEELFCIGVITGKPHGLKGELRVRILTDFPERFCEPFTAHLLPPKKKVKRARCLEVTEGFLQGNIAVIKFKGVNDTKTVSHLSGFTINLPQQERAELLEDEFWFHQLLNAQVLDQQTKQKMGVIRDILESPAHEIFEIQREDQSTFLVPVIKEFIPQIDLESQTVFINWKQDQDETH